MSHALLERAHLLARAGSPSAGTLSFDFDGVVMDHSSGWQDGDLYGAPIPGAVEELQRRIAGGWSVVIQTARDPRFHDEVAAWIRRHTGLETVVSARRHTYWSGSTVLVTNVKPGALSYVDDNAIRFDLAAGGWQTALAGLPFARAEVLAPGVRP